MKTYAMVDNINMGTELDADPAFESTGIECNDKESANLRMVMEKCGADKDKEGNMILIMHPGPAKHKKLGSSIQVSLRKDGRKGQGWFLNVHANPASVFTGDNTFGNLRLKSQVQDIFYYVLSFFEKKGANIERLSKMVKIGNIHIQSVTFALYSSPLKNAKIMQQLVARWYFMYETRVQLEDSQYTSLLQELCLKRSVGDQFEDSIPLAIFASTDKGCKGNKLMHLCVYDKIKEKKSNDRVIESAEEEEDLEKRIRFDLEVSNYCLKKRWSMQQVTLRSLYETVRKRYPERGWRAAVEDLMGYAIHRTCLFYMMTVPNPFIAQYKPMVDLWRKGKEGDKKKWDPRLEKWAAELGIDLDISPNAHLIMLQGQLGLLMNKENLLLDGLSSKKGTDRYIQQLARSMERTREAKRLAQAAVALKLDFSKPTYVEQ